MCCAALAAAVPFLWHRVLKSEAALEELERSVVKLDESLTKLLDAVVPE